MSHFRYLVGERLKELRKARGLSLEELGSALGVTGSHISQIEKGVRQPSLELIAAIAEYFDQAPGRLTQIKEEGIGTGSEIKRLRTEKGLSLGELSQLTKINYFKLGEAERNAEQLTQSELAKVAVALELGRDYFYKSPEAYLRRIEEICTIIFGLEEDEVRLLSDFLQERMQID